MKEENRLALIIAFYISKYDNIAYQNLGYGGITKTHDEIGKRLGIKGTTIQNMRDEFDPYNDNSRKGWHQREMSPSRKEVMSEYGGFSELELRKIIESILNPNSLEQEIFNEIEKEEIDQKEKDIIEGETVERKVLSYKRNSKATATCKKRDDYTCQACGFWYNDKIVECHHLKPLAMVRESVVDMDSLITLCPTCHRLAHDYLRKNEKYTDREALINELQKIRPDQHKLGK